MPIRGETIGTAYIRILADGAGFDDSVRDEMRGMDTEFEHMGERHGTAYNQGIQAAIADGSDFDMTLRQMMDFGRGVADEEGRFFGSDYVKGILEQLEEDHGDIGLVIRKNLQDGLESGELDYRAFGNRLINIRREIAKATVQIATDQQKAEADLIREQERIFNEASQRASADQRATAREALESVQQRAKAMDDFAKQFASDMDEIERSIDRANRANAVDMDAHADRMNQLADDLEHVNVKVTQDMEREAKKRQRIVDEEGNHWDQFADRVGRAFGKGARNDVVNFFGAAIGGVLKIGDIIGGPAKMFGEFAGEVKALIDQGNNLGAFFRVLAGVGTIIAGLGAVTIALGTMTAALSLAAGWVLALASSLSFALVGAIGVAAGALVPLVVGAGVAALAFANMDKEAKAAFKGVGDAFGDLGSSASGAMFDVLGDSIGDLEGIIRGLSPVVDELAASMGGVMLSWIEGLKSPAFDNFVAFIGQTMPRMFTSLGDIAGNLAGSLANIWIAATPFVQEFLSWLAGVTEEWQRLTSGAAGQERLTGFFTNLRGSLISVSGFLESVARLVGEILSAGRDTGDSIFDTMAKNVDEWTAALERNPDILNEWFQNAEKFGEAVGELVIQIAGLIDELDSPEFREFATAIVDVLGDAVKTFGLILRPVVELIASMPSELVQMGFAILAGVTALNKFSAGLRGVGIELGNVQTKAQGAGGAGGLGGFAANIRQLAGGAGLGLLVHGLTNTSNAFTGLETIAGGALLGFAAGGPIGLAIGGTVAAFVALEREARQGGKAVESAADAAKDAVVPWEDLTSTLDSYTGAVTEQTRASVIQKLQAEGMDKQAKALGLTLGDLADAELGNVDARRQVNAAMDVQREKFRNETQEITALQAKRDRFAKDIKNHSTAEIVALDEQIKKKQEEHQATGKLIEQYDQQTQALNRATRARRIEIANLIDWRKEVKGIPPKLITEMRTEGVPRSLAEVGRMADKYNLIKPQIKSLISVLFPDAGPKKVDALIKKLNETGALRPKPKVDVDDSSAQNKMENINADLTSYDRRTVDATVGVNDEASGKISEIDAALSRLPKGPIDIDIRVDTIKTTTTQTRRGAAGGIFIGPTNLLAGEAGPEALVPLNRPLALVDPAVRELSAIAQGLSTPFSPNGTLSINATADQRPIELTIVTPTKEPHAVALETINRLAAVGY